MFITEGTNIGTCYGSTSKSIQFEHVFGTSGASFEPRCSKYLANMGVVAHGFWDYKVGPSKIQALGLQDWMLQLSVAPVSWHPVENKRKSANRTDTKVWMSSCRPGMLSLGRNC